MTDKVRERMDEIISEYIQEVADEDISKDSIEEGLYEFLSDDPRGYELPPYIGTGLLFIRDYIISNPEYKEVIIDLIYDMYFFISTDVAFYHDVDLTICSELTSSKFDTIKNIHQYKSIGAITLDFKNVREYNESDPGIYKINSDDLIEFRIISSIVYAAYYYLRYYKDYHPIEIIDPSVILENYMFIKFPDLYKIIDNIAVKMTNIVSTELEDFMKPANTNIFITCTNTFIRYRVMVGFMYEIIYSNPDFNIVTIDFNRWRSVVFDSCLISGNMDGK